LIKAIQLIKYEWENQSTNRPCQNRPWRKPVIWITDIRENMRIVLTMSKTGFRRSTSRQITINDWKKCYLCTQMTASTMPDLSISMAIVVTTPVHCAPMPQQNIHRKISILIFCNGLYILVNAFQKDCYNAQLSHALHCYTFRFTRQSITMYGLQNVMATGSRFPRDYISANILLMDIIPATLLLVFVIASLFCLIENCCLSRDLVINFWFLPYSFVTNGV